MKKLIVLAFVAFAAVQSFAVGLGLRDAFIVGSLMGDADGNIGTGDAFTFEMLFPVNENFGIHTGAGIEYAMYDFDVDDYNDYHRYIMYVDMSIPVLARLNFTPGFFMDLGVNLGLNLTTLSWVEYGSRSTDAESIDEASGFNVDFAAGMGYVFKFGLGIDGRITYGLTNVFDLDNVDSNRFGIQIGLSYWFKQR